MPPAHINCLTADTLVSTCGRVSNIYKRAYKGTLVEIVTKSGRNITITPNHPILTRRGWKAAGEINCFDGLVCISKSINFGDHYEDNVVAKIGDLFTSADIASDSGLVTVCPTTAKDFHGDVTDSEVNVISVNSFTWNAVRKSFGENGVYDFFVNRKIAGFPLSGFGSVKKFFLSSFATFIRNMSFFGKLKFFFGGRSIHPSLLLLRPVSGCPVFVNYDFFE